MLACFAHNAALRGAQHSVSNQAGAADRGFVRGADLPIVDSIMLEQTEAADALPQADAWRGDAFFKH
jgi:hypothetical protein